jgi:Tol biopolymer transport system component
MEYVAGEDMKSFLKRTAPLSTGRAISISKEICEGLAEAHRLGVVHRDLKPGNIMIDKDGNARIMDFGIARSLKGKGITDAGVMIGTPEYMSPEQVEGEDIDQRSDIYSFGVVLYEMVTGKVPFEGATPLSIALKHKTAEPRNPKEFNAQIPEDLGLLILKCLNKDKAKRFQNAGEVISELTKIESGIATGVQASERRRPFFDSFLKTLRERKIFETLAAFIGAGWLILEVVHWILIDHYHLPEESLDIAIVTLLGVLICTLIWRFFRGVEKKAKKIKIGFVLISAVLLATILFDASIIWKIEKPESKPRREATQAAHKQLTFVGDASSPAISPDGKFIAYVTGQTNIQQKVWVQDTASGRSLEVFNGKYCAGLRWTPDGSEITIYALKDSQRGIFLAPRLGGPARYLESFRYIAWSPDGSQFAGMWEARQDSHHDVNIVNKLTGQPASFDLGGPILFIGDVDWSPSGDRLLVLTISKENAYSIWTAKTDGSQQNAVANESLTLSSPRWSSKGDAIFYLRGGTAHQPQPTELWKLPVSPNTRKPSSPASAVLSGIQMGSSFTLSADGKYLLYTRESQFSNLWLAYIEGSEKSRTVKTKQLTSGTSLHASPEISPDGKRIAFSRGSGETMNIYVMSIAGGTPTQLTYFNSRNTNPVWSPDGREIAFASNEGGKSRVWKISAQGGRPYQFAKTELSIDQVILWAPEPHITYLKTGNRNFQILDPKTEEETSLVKDESVGWIFSPCYSPDGKKVAVYWTRAPAPGLWVISLGDPAEKLIREWSLPFDWSPDGKWIYTYEQKSEKNKYLMIEAESGKTRALPTIPYTIEGKTYHMLIGGQPEIRVVGRTLSDVWIVENFDQIIK